MPTPSDHPRAAANPFTAARLRPGTIPFLFAPGLDADTLVERLRRQDWLGQIVGPHGAGKSTLLETLRTPLEAAGRRLAWAVLRQGDRRLPAELRAPPWDARTLVVVDGAEQLSWLARKGLRFACRRAGAGLLVTTHRDLGLPTLWTVAPSLDTARAVVGQLVPADEAECVTSADVAAAYERASGDIREMLFALYDVYEQRRAAR